jgi:hypothetical protein
MHPRGRRLILPTLALALAAFLFELFGTFATLDWQRYLLWGVTGSIAFFFWLVPLLRYLATFTDITTQRVIARSGLFGQRFREVNLSQVTRIETGRGGRLTIVVSNSEPLELISVAKPKLVASELSRLANL